MLPTLDKQTRLLVIAPHPDDETIGAGGLLQQVREAGGDVRVWLLTDGDNNPWPQRWLERRLWIGARERARWGERRRSEVTRALDALGLGAEQLEGFNWPDMGLTRRMRQQLSAMVDLLGLRLRGWCPNLVVMPDLGDHHPDHGAAHVLLRLALAREGLSPTLLTYLVHGGAPGGSTMALSLTPGQFAAKQRAVAEHTSQTALSGERLRQWVERPETFVVGGGIRSESSSLPWRPSFWQKPLLRLTLVSVAGMTSWTWNRAPLVEHGDGYVSVASEALAAPGPHFVKLHMDLPSPWIFDVWGWREI